jgi:hypothetical protein
VKVAQKLLGVPTLRGGVPRHGVMVEGVKGCKEPPCPPKFTTTVPKTGSFRHFLASKLLKTLFLMFLRNTLIKKIIIT